MPPLSGIQMGGTRTVLTEKISPKKLLKFTCFHAYTQLFINKRQANFNLIGSIFSLNTTHLYTTTTVVKLYTTQTVSVFPAQKITKNYKLFQNPYIN